MSIFTNYGIKFQKSGEKIQNYVKFISDSPRTITPKYTQTGITLEYSINEGDTWTTISSGDTTSSATEHWFRGKATCNKSLYTSSHSTNAWTFSDSSDNKLKIKGNLMFLLCDTMGDKTAPTTIDAYAFNQMFRNCSSLEEAPELPATTLADYCYYQMFYGCSSLKTAPELPATTLANYCCYEGMFRNCSSLEEAPELPATTLAENCYSNMFQNCSSLKTAPELPATTLAKNCYSNMFQNCSSLKSIYLSYENNNNPNNAFTSWVSDISTNGTLYKKGTLFASSGNDTYPSNWTQVAWVND